MNPGTWNLNPTGERLKMPFNPKFAITPKINKALCLAVTSYCDILCHFTATRISYYKDIYFGGFTNECQKAGLPEPEFKEEFGGFSVCFYKDIYSEEKLRKMNNRQAYRSSYAIVQKLWNYCNVLCNFIQASNSY